MQQYIHYWDIFLMHVFYQYNGIESNEDLCKYPEMELTQ